MNSDNTIYYVEFLTGGNWHRIDFPWKTYQDAFFTARSGKQLYEDYRIIQKDSTGEKLFGK